MKKITNILKLATLIPIFITMSCTSSPKPVLEPVVEEEPVILEEEPEPVVEVEPAPEVEIAEPEPMPEPEPEVEEFEPGEEEYQRSTVGVEVSMEDFSETKKHILHVIEKMDLIMKNRDYDEWKKYVDKKSLDYYSQKANLNKATNKLPKKGLQLKTSKDYFLWVFIPARIGHSVDEIRYVTKDFVKVVSVKDNTDSVYYTCIKVNDVWKVSLPRLSD